MSYKTARPDSTALAVPRCLGFVPWCSRRRWASALAGVLLLAGCHAVPPAGEHAGGYRYVGDGMPYVAFDRLPSSIVKVPGGSIQVAFAGGGFALPKARLLRWVKASARTVAGYYGRFPVSHVQLLIVPVRGGGVRSGSAFAYGGPAIRVLVGRRTSAAALQRDWILVHEMVHMAFPMVRRQHHWIEEGLAVYIEGVARVQAGRLSRADEWEGLIDGMPHGEPGPGDRGLDHTPTWGRTYWGGAMFCLLADIRIREQTHNRKGLQDALRGILAAGGDMSVDWPITRAFRAGDAATGVPVLMTLYDRMKDKPAPVDLARLWQRLGVIPRGDTVAFNGNAPLAAVRRAIMRAPHPARQAHGRRRHLDRAGSNA